MNYNICPECKTENEAKYRYCKNCGAALFSEEETKNNTDYSNFENGGNPNKERDLEYIDGIPADEVACYIGKESRKIMPKILKMEATRSKTSWCWPVAILSGIFGPIGAAIWFLYRRMYKLGIFFLAAAVVCNILVINISGGKDIISESALEEFLYSYNSNDMDAVVDFFKNNINKDAVLGGYIDNTISVVCLIVTGLFGYFWYKNDIVKKIYKYRSVNVDSRYYQMGLMSLGGTSVGAVVLGVLAYTFIPSIIGLVVFSF